MRSSKVRVFVNLTRIRDNVQRIRRLTGVPVLAVVKADAYGLGLENVVSFIEDAVDGFCVFSLSEAIEGKIRQLTNKRVLALGPPDSESVSDYIRLQVQPSVSTVEQARRLCNARPIINVDTGMQRFSCDADQIQSVIDAGDCKEAFTHAANIEQVRRLLTYVGDRQLQLHAAGSALLQEPTAWLDAVRPGIALYRDAVRVSTYLVECRDTHGLVGYTGFSASRHGIILVGYSHGLRPGHCWIGGQMRRILEVGMQSSYVEIGPSDAVGQEVILLGEGINLQDQAEAWSMIPHEALMRLAGMGTRYYET
jgi:alanine racemase